jgi:hypothetical protein
MKPLKVLEAFINQEERFDKNLKTNVLKSIPVFKVQVQMVDGSLKTITTDIVAILAHNKLDESWVALLTEFWAPFGGKDVWMQMMQVSFFCYSLKN